jgi:hypothetical protein
MTAIIVLKFIAFCRKKFELRAYSSVREPKLAVVWKLGLGVSMAFHVR